MRGKTCRREEAPECDRASGFHNPVEIVADSDHCSEEEEHDGDVRGSCLWSLLSCLRSRLCGRGRGRGRGCRGSSAAIPHDSDGNEAEHGNVCCCHVRLHEAKACCISPQARG